jgi:hypothetical protein
MAAAAGTPRLAATVSGERSLPSARLAIDLHAAQQQRPSIGRHSVLGGLPLSVCAHHRHAVSDDDEADAELLLKDEFHSTREVRS